MSDPLTEAEAALREAERQLTTAKCALRDARKQRDGHLTHDFKPAPVEMCAGMDGDDPPSREAE
jgi:hypothetical protein